MAKKYMKDEYEQIDLIGKKTQRTATTVEVSDCAAEQRVACVRWVLRWLDKRGCAVTLRVVDTHIF